jgi:hypothetical protein
MALNPEAWEQNMKRTVEEYQQLGVSTLSELVLSQQQIRRQQDVLFDTLMTHKSNLNTIGLLAMGSFKTIEDKLLDPDATEIASQAMSTATALGSQTSQDTKTLADMTAAMSQMTQKMTELIATLSAQQS